VISGISEVAITTKQDMSRWTRAHADVPGIRWSVFAGPGGTMIIVEHAEDRCSLAKAGDVRSDATPAPVLAPVPALVPSAIVPASTAVADAISAVAVDATPVSA
jgi:hypothetical protein